MRHPALVGTALSLFAVAWSTSAFAHIGQHHQLNSAEIVQHFAREPSHLPFAILVLAGLSIATFSLCFYGWKLNGELSRSGHPITDDTCHPDDNHK